MLEPQTLTMLVHFRMKKYDLVLIAETKKLLLEKVRKWKEGMEKKGLRVNAGKTKFMWCKVSKGQAENAVADEKMVTLLRLFDPSAARHSTQSHSGPSNPLRQTAL